MSFQVIPNQPVLLRPAGFDESCVCCEAQRDHCMLVGTNDYIYLQGQMTPCGDDFICRQPVLGPELVENGSFDTSSGWQAAGNNWTIAGGTACYTAADGAGVLYQTIAGLTEGLTYLLQYSISNYVAGTLRPFLWDTAGTVVSADGDYAEEITIAPGHISETLNFIDNAWNGCITNISLRLNHDCWDTSFSGDDPFSFSEDAVCINGSGTLFTDTLSNGPGYFMATFTISNYVSGTMLVRGACADTWLGGPFSSGGEKFAYGVFAAPGVFCFEFADFIGCISDVHLYRLFIPQFILVSQTSGYQYLELNEGAFLSFVEDRVIIKFRPLEFLPEDCYKICVIDTCKVSGKLNLVTNGTFDSDLSGWTDTNGNWAWDVTNGGEAKSSGVGCLEQIFSAGQVMKKVCARVTVNDISGVNATLALRIVNTLTGVINASVNITGKGVYSICGTGDQVDLCTANTTTPSIEIDNVFVEIITDCEDCELYDYCSNCIKYGAFDECKTKLIEGYNDENNSWGFIWNNSSGNNVFKLSHRLIATLNNPRYPEDSVDYTFSNGETKDTYAESEKTQQLFVEQETERVHDVVRLQKRGDHLVITDANGTGEYWAEKGDYNPEWTEPAGSCVAPARFRIKKKNATLYNNLCG